ncbi:MAG: hypothetical protein IJ681_09155 [Bacteroidales bacterium]|nr:hypothetical protein [Bacteroidales bacterium]
MEFSFHRALNVLNRKVYTNRKSLLIFAGIFFFISTVACFVAAMNSVVVRGVENMHLPIASIVLASVIIAGIWPFLELTEKENAVFELMYPASRLEKFIIEVLFAFIILPIFVIILSILGLYAGTSAFKLYMLREGFSIALPEIANLFSGYSDWSYSSYIVTVGAIIISFLGAVLFYKWRVLKIWVCVGTIGFLFVVICGICMYNYKKATGHWFPYSITTNGYFDPQTQKMVYKTAAFYKGQELDYIPWFFKEIFWNVVCTLFFAGMFCLTWILYKNRKA